MFEKSGKFYADWRDRQGKRLRKSFNSARAALQHEAEQREIAHPKQTAQGKPSPKSFAPNMPGTRSHPTPDRQPKPSSRMLVRSLPISSAPRTSQTSTKRSVAAVIPIQRKPAAPPRLKRS